MTRKKYIHKLQELMIAVWNHPDCKRDYKLGESLKHARDYAKEVPKHFGSYQTAYDSEPFTTIQKMLGIPH